MSQRLEDRHLLGARFGAVLFGKARRHPIALVTCQPSCILRPIRQHKQSRSTEQNCRNAFEQKQPTPAWSIEPMRTENGARNWSAYDETNRNRGHKSRHRLGPVLINEPVRV